LGSLPEFAVSGTNIGSCDSNDRTLNGTTEDQRLAPNRRWPVPLRHLGGARCDGIGQLGAHTGSVKFVLRALAARKMRHERKIQGRSAAEETAIRAGRSMDQALNLQIAGLSRHCNLTFQRLVSAFRDLLRSRTFLRRFRSCPLVHGNSAEKQRLKKNTANSKAR